MGIPSPQEPLPENLISAFSSPDALWIKMVWIRQYLHGTGYYSKCSAMTNEIAIANQLWLSVFYYDDA
jgi:hypothetical protein